MPIFSQRSKEGYLRVDNRLGGPLAESQLAQIAALEAKGVYVTVTPPASQLESATITCSHCHVTFIRNPQRIRARSYCAKCDHYICDSPVCNAECNPMKRTIDLLQEQIFQQGR
jgi:hypothetical protein